MEPVSKAAPNLVLVGPMGAGKTAVARRLAARFGLHAIDLDREIERRRGASVAAIFASEGEAGFRAHEQAVLMECLSREGQVVATGGGAVLDPGNRALMRSRGFVVHLQVGVERQLARLAADHTRPLLAGADRERVLRDLATARAPLYAEVAHLVFDTDPWNEDEAADRLADRLSAHWQPQGAAA